MYFKYISRLLGHAFLDTQPPTVMRDYSYNKNRTPHLEKGCSLNNVMPFYKDQLHSRWNILSNDCFVFSLYR